MTDIVLCDFTGWKVPLDLKHQPSPAHVARNWAFDRDLFGEDSRMMIRSTPNTAWTELVALLKAAHRRVALAINFDTTDPLLWIETADAADNPTQRQADTERLTEVFAPPPSQPPTDYST